MPKVRSTQAEKILGHPKLRNSPGSQESCWLLWPPFIPEEGKTEKPRGSHYLLRGNPRDTERHKGQPGSKRWCSEIDDGVTTRRYTTCSRPSLSRTSRKCLWSKTEIATCSLMAKLSKTTRWSAALSFTSSCWWQIWTFPRTTMKSVLIQRTCSSYLKRSSRQFRA